MKKPIIITVVATICALSGVLIASNNVNTADSIIIIIENIEFQIKSIT